MRLTNKKTWQKIYVVKEKGALKYFFKEVTGKISERINALLLLLYSLIYDKYFFIIYISKSHLPI